MRRTGMRSIGWSIRSFDTVEKESKKVVKRVAKRIKGGDIVLLHDTLEGVIETTEALLQYIAAKGYKAVSIDELLIDKK